MLKFIHGQLVSLFRRDIVERDHKAQSFKVFFCVDFNYDHFKPL